MGVLYIATIAAMFGVGIWLGDRIGFDRAWKKAGGEVCNMGFGEVLIAPTCKRCGHVLRLAPTPPTEREE